MKKKLFLFSISVFLLQQSFAQINQWTWISGSNNINQVPVYGTKGTANASNVPGARYMSNGWTGTTTNLWLYGGHGYDAAGNLGIMNDLWRYDGTNWTWISGDNVRNRYGVYGTKGTAHASNIPGGRQQTVTGKNASGNFLLFGGYGYGLALSGYLNDLWRWDGTNWTWISGTTAVNQAGIYGTKGTAAGTNMPGSRRQSISWTDATGNFWVFGGNGYDAAGTVGQLNDLWRWDGTNWTWISGSNTVNQTGVYGTKGTAAGTNIPGSREDGVTWIDASNNLWLFGGYGYDAFGTLSRLNDLWRWNGTNWTWMSGYNTANLPGTYGTRGVANASNTPGARGSSVGWKDLSGNFWLFGGSGSGESAGGILNDVWFWNGTAWTWASGSKEISTNGVYGTKNVAAAANMPGSKNDATGWTDNSGNFWLYGGTGYGATGSSGRMNDLWTIVPDPIILPLHLISFTGNAANKKDRLQWITEDEMNTKEFLIQRSADGSNFTTIAVVAAKGSGNNSYAYETASAIAASSYYRLKMVDEDQQFTYSPVISLRNEMSGSVHYYPNPTKGNVTLQINDRKLLGSYANVVDVNGKIVLRMQISDQLMSFDIQQVAKGFYFIHFANGTIQKLVKE